MTDPTTINPDQLGLVTEIPEDLHVVVWSPGGPLAGVPHRSLLSRLTGAGAVHVDAAALQADLAHAESVVGLVHTDPDPLKNGWYRKTGASGAGAWVQFETLALAVHGVISAAASQAAAMPNFRATLAEAVADFAVGVYFSCAETGHLRVYKRTAGAPGYLDMGDAAAPVTKGLLAAPTGGTAIGYRPPGAGAIATTVGAHLDRVLHQADFASYAQAEAAAGNSKPLWCYPQTNSGLPGADTQIGLRIGHLVLGGPGDRINDLDAYVTLLAHETYANIEQEVRIAHFGSSYHRNGVADEATLGWDLRIATAFGVIEPDNNQYLRGNMNPFTAEWFFVKPTTGAYAAKNTYLYSTHIEIGQNVTAENIDLAVFKAPVGSSVPGGGTGVIQRLRGIVIQNLAAYINPTMMLAAIHFEGAAESGRLWWGGNCHITKDLGSKLEIAANDAAISLVHAKVRPTAGAVFTHIEVIANGTPGCIPVHALS